MLNLVIAIGFDLLSNIHLPNTYYMPSTMKSTGDIEVNDIITNPAGSL